MAGQQQQQNSQNDQSYDQAILQSIRQQICLNNHQLLELTYNDQKFKQKVKQLNHLGCDSIVELKYHQALIYLNQAEKVLQYAASCGKTIERTLIITTLNNQASLYQRAWQLEKVSSYVQAIIYNISQFFDKDYKFIFTPNILDQNSLEYQDFRIYLWRKKILALYFLQFCAVNSQNKKHQNALNSASKAILLLKQICSHCYNYQNYVKTNNNNNNNYDNNNNNNHKNMNNNMEMNNYNRSENKNIGQNNKNQRNILEQLQKLKPLDRNQNNTQKLFTKAIKCIAVYIKRSQQSQEVQQEKKQQILQLKKKFSVYSIGHLMQINPLKLQKDSDKIDLNKQISLGQKIFKAIYVSIGHFISATELRFISTQKYTYDQNQRKNSFQYKQSQNYHLYAIIIAAKFLPCNSVYFQHIVNNFKNHYKIDLMENAKQYLQNNPNPNPIDQDQYFNHSQHQTQTNEVQQSQPAKQVQQIKKYTKIQKKNIKIKQKEEIKPKQQKQQQNQNIQKISVVQIQKNQKTQKQNDNFDIKTQKSQEIIQDFKKIQILLQDQNNIILNDTKYNKKIKKIQTNNKKNITASKKNLLKNNQVKNLSSYINQKLYKKSNQNRFNKTYDKQSNNNQVTNRSSVEKQNKLSGLKNKSSKSQKKTNLQFNNNISKKSQIQNSNFLRKTNASRQNSCKKLNKDSDYNMDIVKSRSKSKKLQNQQSLRLNFKKKDFPQIKKNKKVQEQYGINMAKTSQRQIKNAQKQHKKSKSKSKQKSKKKSVQKSIKFTSPELKLKKLKSPRNTKKVINT